MIAVGGLAVLAALPQAEADTPTQYGWWGRLGPLPTLGAPDDGLFVSHDISGPQAISAVRLASALPGTLTLTLAEGESAEGFTLTAHPATSDWEAAQNGAFADAPTFDAETAVEGKADASTVRFALPDRFPTNDGFVDVVVVSGGSPVGSVAFQEPGDETFVSSAPDSTAPPATQRTSPPATQFTPDPEGGSFAPIGGSFVSPTSTTTVPTPTSATPTAEPGPTTTLPLSSVSVGAGDDGGWRFEFPFPVLLLGAITGLTYGVLAVGIILVYRSNRVINFAHGEIGAFAAALLGVTVTRWGVPYWVAFPVALIVAAAVGGMSEVVIIRRLRNAPAVMTIVATLGLAQFLLLFSLVVNSQASAGRLFPQPAWLPEFDVGALRVTPAYSGMLFMTPPLVAGIVWFLRRSRYGLAIRASAANPEAARMSGVFAARMSTLTWAIAGSLSAFTAILVLPTRGFANAQFLGPGLLMRALTAAVIARMTNLPIGLAAGVGIGIIEQTLLWNYPRGGLVEMVLFVIVLAALVLQPHKTSARDDEKGSWASVQPWPPLPERFTELWPVRNLGWIATGAVAAIALLMPVLTTNSTSIILVVIMAFTVVGLSIGVVTGLGGQLSLGQFALAGVGATASFVVATETGNFAIGFLAAGLAAAAVSLVIGLPALRIRGLMLAVTTLGFALATQGWLFQQSWMLGEGIDPGRPVFGDTQIDTGKKYYLFALLPLGFAFWMARNVWKGGIGRRLRAIRDNEAGARAFTVPATTVKLQGFALAGFLAGIGGALYGHALSRLSSTAFPIGASIDATAMTVLGGIGVLAGPLVGAFYIIGVPEFLPLDNAGLAATALGWLVLILYFPGGIAQVIKPQRDRLIDLIARLGGLDPTGIRIDDDVEDMGSVTVSGRLTIDRSIERETPDPGVPLLQVQHIRRHFGGVKAVDGVTFDVRPGEIVGLIGPNGAGKTTLFELLGGFTKADEGKIRFAGEDITGMRPEARGKRGLIRSFQDAALFPTMTVVETVMLSIERAEPTRVAPALLGLSAADRRKEVRARELVGTMGLYQYRNKQIRELSTGTRRITELACLVALEPTLLLLDEPASGIAQRETEALGDLLQLLKDSLDMTLIVIEHDIPMVMRLSDRILAMESGRMIADGSPEEVRNDPLVIESYLGGDVTAIERSGVLSGVGADA